MSEQRYTEDIPLIIPKKKPSSEIPLIIPSGKKKVDTTPITPTSDLTSKSDGTVSSQDAPIIGSPLKNGGQLNQDSKSPSELLLGGGGSSIGGLGLPQVTDEPRLPIQQPNVQGGEQRVNVPAEQQFIDQSKDANYQKLATDFPVLQQKTELLNKYDELMKSGIAKKRPDQLDQLGQVIVGALDLPKFINGNAQAILSGVEKAHSSINMMQESNFGISKKFYEGLTGAVLGSAQIGIGTAMNTPAGYAFTQAINVDEVYGNGEASKLIMQPLTTLLKPLGIEPTSEIGKNLVGIGDLAGSVIGLGIAHAALRGEDVSVVTDAKKDLDAGKDLTGDKVKLLTEFAHDQATPENLTLLHDAAASLPDNTPQKKIADLTEKLAAIDPATLKLIPTDLPPEQKIEVAPLVEQRENLSAANEKLKSDNEKITEPLQKVNNDKIAENEKVIKTTDGQILAILDSKNKSEPIELPVEEKLPDVKQEEDIKIGDVNLNEEFPKSNPKIHSQEGLPDLDIHANRAQPSVDSNIGDSGKILDGIRTINLEDFDTIPMTGGIKQLGDAIKENGWIEPLIIQVNKNGDIWIAEGQHRAAALKEMGYKTAPVKVIYDANDAIPLTPKRVSPKAAINEQKPIEQGTETTQEGKPQEEVKTVTKKQLKEERNSLLNRTPVNAREAVLQYFSGGGRISTADIKRELGASGKELRSKIWAHGNKYPSVDRLVLDLQEELRVQSGLDVPEDVLRNEIIDVLHSHSGRSGMIDELRNMATKEDRTTDPNLYENVESDDAVKSEYKNIDEDTQQQFDQADNIVDSSPDQWDSFVDHAIQKFSDENGNLDIEGLSNFYKSEEFIIEDVAPKKVKEQLQNLIKNENRRTETNAEKTGSESATEISDSASKSKEENAKEKIISQVKPTEDGTSKNGGNKAKAEAQKEDVLASKEKSGGEEGVAPVLETKAEEDGGNMSGITHERTAQAREEFGLGDPYEKRDPVKDEELNIKAEEEIKKGYNIETLLSKIESKDHRPTELETVILKKHKAGLEAQIEKNPTPENLQELRRFVKATDKVGSLQGAEFRQRQGLELRDDSLAGYFNREIEVNQDAPLTETQHANVIKEHEAITKAQEALNEKVAKLEQENAKLRADQEIKKTKSTTKREKKSHEDFVKEREDIAKSIREKLKSIRQSPQATVVPYARELIEISPDVAKLVKSYVSEGIDKLEDIVKNIHSDFKNDIPDLKEKDIHDIIAGEYNKKKPTKNELAAKVFELKEQARLTNKLEALMNGVEPKSEKAKIKRNQEIESLRQKINEHDLTKLATYKGKLKSDIEKVEKDLANENYEKPEKKIPLKLDSEARKLKDNLIKLKQEREIRLIKKEYANRSLQRKAVDKLTEVLNVPRTLMSSSDFSAPLRQGIIATVAHPTVASKAFVEMFRQSVSQKRFDRWFSDIKESARYQLSRAIDLYIADPHDPRLTAKEEAFMNNLAEKIPIIGQIVKGSERAYVGYLNKLRWDLFNRFADEFEAQGKTFENSPELYKGLASYINNATGRGKLGALESAAPILNSAIFAPRLIASRLNMLNPIYYKNLPKPIRVEALKSMAKFIGLGVTVLAIAKAGGAEVEDNPLSSDFGKIKDGNTRWDMWGGFQPYIRVLAQEIMGKSKSARTGVTQDLSGEGTFGKTRFDVAQTFLRGKLAPIPSMGWDYLSGRTMTGEDVTLKEEAMQHLLPMIAGDLKDAMQDRGVKALFDVGIPSNFGVSVSTYLPSGYDKKMKEDPTYKALYQKNMNINQPQQGELSDDDYKTFLKKREPIFKKKWADIIKNGAFVDEDGKLTLDASKEKSKIDFDKLTQEDLSDLMKSISNSATRKVKSDLEKPDNKSVNIPINHP